MSEQQKLQTDLRDELIRMVKEDWRVREELAADGSLFKGYHQRMAEVHQRNGRRLGEIIDQYGWPGKTLVGEEGADAAWLIVQHDIGNPSLQRRSLPLLREAVARGKAHGWQLAMLTDRICVLEGKRQVYGTQYDWDEHGEMSPCPIENPEQVDELRESVGLIPLQEDTRLKRDAVLMSSEKPPADLKARRQEMQQWARSTGWLD
ncbi:MAG TPA: DUF6624 domain-containing protein [Pyrinomonadaceae bacterium]|jgi:hypothetical protein|nr:DUF6624 domain-containing protein [Pyrinomonadaceae bacterium]